MRREIAQWVFVISATLLSRRSTHWKTAPNGLRFGILMDITETEPRRLWRTMGGFDLLQSISSPLIPELERNRSRTSIIIRSRLIRRAKGFSTSRDVLSIR